MPRNLELKASLPSIESARASARRCGAEFHGILHQVDTYFFTRQGRLKFREVEGQGAELIYYERSDTAAERWSTYSTVRMEDPETLKKQLSSALGIRVVVRKSRALFLLHGARIHIDEVEGLGAFLEFEVPVRDEEGALHEMKYLRAQFAVADESIFTTSYSDLILAKTEDLGT
jgi:adenylate cyclase class 2